jgi:repressor LexA
MARQRRFSKSDVLARIQQWMLDHRVGPTIKELQGLLKVGSTRTVMRYLDWLESEGDIERVSGARGIRLRRAPTATSLATQAVPIVGVAPAGALMTAEQNTDGWVRLPQSLMRPATAGFYLLQVRGNSMNQALVKGERIENNDLILVRQQLTANPRDIVVALIDGEATIKRLVRSGAHWLLKPESTESKHQSIVVGPGFRVQGIVVHVIKKGSELLRLIEN